MAPLAARILLVFLAGLCLGSIVNWAIYTLAWFPRPISPWSVAPLGAGPRTWLDRVPVLGWLRLRREAKFHGPRHWLRPMALELSVGVALAALYWWEIERLGLVREQFFGLDIQPPTGVLHWQFASHAILCCWMLAASFIDIDEKIIPDEITITGTLLGLVLATALPMSLLPDVVPRGGPRGDGAPAVPLTLATGAPAVDAAGVPLWLEAVTPISPREWPPMWGRPRTWRSLLIGLGCYWLWCFALAPRIWRGRRGPLFALALIARRVRRELARPPLRLLLVLGSVAIGCVWAIGESRWAGLSTALIGLVGSGGLVWAVRLIGTAALRREAMGFGDVTLMMMVGTFLGWQACLIAFFLAPFAGLVVGILQFVLRRDDVIPYGPFLCLGSAAVVVAWAPIWMWGKPLFELGWLVPSVVVICLALLGLLLGLWRIVKETLFGRGEYE